jgi:hypothetical protein
LLAVKLPRAEVWKLSDPEEEARLSNATSEGELTLVGTWFVENVGGPLVRPTSESLGKTWYISTTTWLMFAVVLPPVSRPVKVAPVIEVWATRGKSSPVSISNFPALSGRAAVAILPSGLPVLKKKASAIAGNGVAIATKMIAAIPVRAFEGMSVMIFLRRLCGR